MAIEYHMRHLRIAQELLDKTGESRAYWSLSNALAAVGRNQEALTNAQKHLQLATELADGQGQAAAETAIAELQRKVEEGESAAPMVVAATPKDLKKKRLSMDNMELLKMTPEITLHDEAAASNLHVNLLVDKVNGPRCVCVFA